MDKTKTFISLIVTVISLVGVSFSAFFFLEGRYTPLAAFASLERRVSLEELRRQLRQAEDDAAYYRQQLRKYPSDPALKSRSDKSEKRLRKLEELLKKKEFQI